MKKYLFILTTGISFFYAARLNPSTPFFQPCPPSEFFDNKHPHACLEFLTKLNEQFLDKKEQTFNQFAAWTKKHKHLTKNSLLNRAGMIVHMHELLQEIPTKLGPFTKPYQDYLKQVIQKMPFDAVVNEAKTIINSGEKYYTNKGFRAQLKLIAVLIHTKKFDAYLKNNTSPQALETILQLLPLIKHSMPKDQFLKLIEPLKNFWL